MKTFNAFYQEGNKEKVNQIVQTVTFLYERIQHAKQNGTSYFYPTETFRSEIQELKQLRMEYKKLTGEWLVIN